MEEMYGTELSLQEKTGMSLILYCLAVHFIIGKQE